MTRILADLEPKNVFKYFEEISLIPRCSGNEKEISDYMVSFAKNLGLEVIQDDVYNIIIKKPATPGYENSDVVILQGHLDMVGEKDSKSNHDFDKDPLQLYIDGDLVRAKGTTLGADNGMAIAYQMAVLADNTLKHPALEIFMTVDEERGMTGVANMNPDNLDGKILINLDSEEEGEFLVSCAGGIRTQIEVPKETKLVNNNNETYNIKISGLKGGHSGAEIHLERANSNMLMGRVLNDLKDKIEFDIVSIDGGTKDNVITIETNAIINTNEKNKEVLNNVLNKWDDIFKKEYRVVDPDICVSLDKVDIKYETVLSDKTKSKVISTLVLHPYGVQSMSHDMDNLVETSLNLGVVTTTDDSIVFSSALRSSSATRKENLINQVKELANVLEVEFKKTADYPAWEYNPNSKIREIATRVYKEYTKEEPRINAIHAGLECGFISEKLPGVDMISFGPNIRGAHTTDENVSISSTKRIWDYLVKLLEELK